MNFALPIIQKVFHLCILVFVEMTPMTLYARLDNTSELTCSIHYRGYAWSVVNILQQNISDSVLLLNVSRDGEVESKNARINGSVTISEDYINVTVSFDLSSGSGVCELNQTYSCDIQLTDTSIVTMAASSILMLESKYTLPWQFDAIVFFNCHVIKQRMTALKEI